MRPVFFYLRNYPYFRVRARTASSCQLLPASFRLVPPQLRTTFNLGHGGRKPFGYLLNGFLWNDIFQLFLFAGRWWPWSFSSEQLWPEIPQQGLIPGF
jgi:hypothetical protein